MKRRKNSYLEVTPSLEVVARARVVDEVEYGGKERLLDASEMTVVKDVPHDGRHTSALDD